MFLFLFAWIQEEKGVDRNVQNLVGTGEFQKIKAEQNPHELVITSFLFS